MIKIARSNLGIEDVFTHCIDNYSGNISTDFNEQLKLSMEKEEEEYISLAQANALHNVRPPNFEDKEQKSDFHLLYRNKLKKTKINDTISELSFNKCPICLLPNPKTLDHVLPKELFYNFSLTPVNLVPMCDSCNRKKGEKHGTSYVRSTFHPYFDDLDYHDNVRITVTFNHKYIDVSINLMQNSLSNDFYNKLCFNFYELYKVDEPFKSDFLGVLRNISNGWQRNNVTPDKLDVQEIFIKKKRRAYEDYLDEKNQGGLFFFRDYIFYLFYDELIQQLDIFYKYLMNNNLVIKFQ